jgi:hypothetical protein
MRTRIAFVGSLMGSIAFQVSVALYPDKLQHYAYLVKWVWIACGVSWMAWLLSHPWMRTHLWAHSSKAQQNHLPTAPQPETQHETRHKSPIHNVQFVGFKRIPIDPDLPELALATLCFENVLIPRESIADFRFARLRVNYRDFSTGETIAEAFPARWHNSPDDPIDILAGEEKCAIIASCFGSKWATDSLIDVPANPALEYGFGGSEYKRESVPLPLGCIKVKATLIGEHNLSIQQVSGILTLAENGNASFTPNDSV